MEKGKMAIITSPTWQKSSFFPFFWTPPQWFWSWLTWEHSSLCRFHRSPPPCWAPQILTLNICIKQKLASKARETCTGWRVAPWFWCAPGLSTLGKRCYALKCEVKEKKSWQANPYYAFSFPRNCRRRESQVLKIGATFCRSPLTKQTAKLLK